jgi:phosphate transport system substrate-binding protein
MKVFTIKHFALYGLVLIVSYWSVPALAVETKTLTWAGCSISKTAFMSEMAEAYEKKTGVKIDLKGGGATKGIRQVSAKEVSIGGTCRHIIEDPKSNMTIQEERRVQLTPVAWDALVVIVHKDNAVNNMSLDQVRDLLKGRITNWKQLGGKDAPVELYVRKGKISGVGRTLREILFSNYDEEFVAAHVVEESATLEKDMVTNPNGVGITGVSSARKLVGVAKILQLEGKEPTFENIRGGKYLLYRPLYMVTHMQETEPEVKHFINFVMGAEGKAIMRRAGTVPYEDAISLWLKYIDQQNKALAHAIARADEGAAKSESRARKN